MKDQKAKGILLSYLNTAFNMCFNLLVVPMLISALSDAQYGIYKVKQCFAGPLMMLNLGMSTIVVRAISGYRELQTEQAKLEKESTLFLASMISVVMAVVVFLLGMAMTGILPYFFAKTYNQEELDLAKKLLSIFTCTTALHILSDTFRGSALGNERFVFYYGTTTVQYVLRLIAIVALIQWTDLNAIMVAMVDLVLYAGIAIANICYSAFRLKERIHMHFFRREELVNIAMFSAAVLLQAIVTQVNNNVDNIILGAMIIDKKVITMYSSALSIFSIYNVLLSVFSNVYLPKAARLVTKGASVDELMDLVIHPGRIQAVIAVAIVCAFGLFGGNFIKIWIGEQHLAAWPVTLMLMIPVTIPLVQNMCVAILNAKLKQTFRSIVLFVMAIINVVLSVILVKYIGFWGAALGTAISILIGHVIAMNIYYHKVIGLRIFKMFREIFRGILPAGLITTAVCLPLAIFVMDTMVGFLIKCLVFVCIYLILLWTIGLQPKEKERIAEMCRGFLRR